MLGGKILSQGRGVALATWQRSASVLNVPRSLTWLLIVAASLYLVGFVVAGSLRLTYAYPFDRTEEASVDVLRHILHGEPAYGPPTLSYVPVVYPPLYFYVAAIAASFTGASLLPLRLVSLLASLMGGALVFGLVRRETNNRTLGLVSAALFTGSTHVSLTSLDLARVDALGTTFMLGAVYWMRTADLRPGSAGRASAVAGLLAGLSVITKQTNAALAVALLGYAALTPRARLLPYALALAASIGLPVAVLYAQVGEWMRFYLFELPSRHVLEDKQLDTFWTANIFPRFTLPLVVGPLFLVGRIVRGQFRTTVFYAVASASLLFMAWLGWAGRGAAQNVLEPAYAALCVMFGLGLWQARSLLAERTQEHHVLRNYVLAMCLGQFVILGYNPRATVPLRSDGWANDRLTATFANLPGTVLAPDYGEWAHAAGKGDQPSTGALLELTGAFALQDNPTGDRWREELSGALQKRQYDYVLWDPQSDAFVIKNLVEANTYVNVGSLFQPDDEFNIWKSGRTPDVQVYVPAERASTFKPTEPKSLSERRDHVQPTQAMERLE